MSLSATTFRIHRWLGWVVGLQVLAWVLGGVLFSLLPIQALVKGGDTVQAPKVVLPAGWADATAAGLQAAARQGDVTGVSTVATSRGAALRVAYAGGREPVFVPADGSAWAAPDEASVRTFATGLYRGTARVAAVERVAEVPRRLVIVAETASRSDLWRVRFDDALGTRIYLHGRSGEFVMSRNDAWVWYDFFWRLHIMDYGGGEDINNTLLRATALTALGLVTAGLVLAVLAIRRRWKRRR